MRSNWQRDSLRGGFEAGEAFGDAVGAGGNVLGSQPVVGLLKTFIVGGGGNGDNKGVAGSEVLDGKIFSGVGDVGEISKNRLVV